MDTGQARMTVCEVIANHPDRRTVDVISNNAVEVKNIPIVSNCGLNEDDEVWGTLELPSVGTHVLIDFVSGQEGSPVVIGTIIPWAYSKYQSNQVPVNSDNKQFTLKLLEDVDEKTYRKIFKSGTTLEVGEDGTLTLEVPSGTYLQIDEENEVINLEDLHGNIVTLDVDGIYVTDTNGNTVTMDSSGTSIEDANGNAITMGSTSVTINGNLEVLQ